MAGFQNREEFARAQFHGLFGDSVKPSPSIEQILGLGPRRKNREPLQGSLAKAESLKPRLVKQPQSVRQNRP